MRFQTPALAITTALTCLSALVGCDSVEAVPFAGFAGEAGDSGAAGKAAAGTSGSAGGASSGGNAGVGGSGAAGNAGAASAGSSGAGARELCGNGQIEPGETCDDKNATLCDGCEGCEKRYSLVLPPLGYANVADLHTRLPANNQAVCFEAWVKTNETAKNAVYFSSAASETNANFLLRCTETTLEFSVQNGDKKTSAYPPHNCRDGKWHHVSACRWINELDGKLTLRIMWDGTPIASAGGDVDSIGSAATIYIGGTAYAQQGLDGAIDEFAIIARNRSSPFVPVRHPPVDEQTLALFHFDEGLGTSFYDATSNKASGSIVGGSFVVDAGYKSEMCQ